ncbi:MAG: hypothetical protein N3G21_10620 [Candidatus Hydrogenedentes bacterium]|nr:hypothetical protein [Candidatus Hydrogenedentota bacterium]
MFPKHPTRAQLILYAESVLEGKGPIYSGIGRHVVKCNQCKQEVEAIKTSLRFFNTEVSAEPPEELAHEILREAKKVAQKRKFEKSTFQYRRPIITGICCFLVWWIVGYYAFVEFYLKPYSSFVDGISIQKREMSQLLDTKVGFQKEIANTEVSSLWHQIEILSPAIMSILRDPDIKTYPYLKMVSLLDEEIEKARKALKKYPEDERIKRLIRDNMREKIELLKSIYKESVL